MMGNCFVFFSKCYLFETHQEAVTDELCTARIVYCSNWVPQTEWWKRIKGQWWQTDMHNSAKYTQTYTLIHKSHPDPDTEFWYRIRLVPNSVGTEIAWYRNLSRPLGRSLWWYEPILFNKFIHQVIINSSISTFQHILQSENSNILAQKWFSLFWGPREILFLFLPIRCYPLSDIKFTKKILAA